MPPAGTDGGGLELDVAAELRNWSRQDGRGRAFGPSSGVKLPDGSVRAADAAWISWPRWNALSPSEQEGYAPICPEFVIEVRSKSDRLAPLQQKMDQWIANGAQLAWLIDPMERAITIYRPDNSPEYLTNPTSVQGTGPIRLRACPIQNLGLSFDLLTLDESGDLSHTHKSASAVCGGRVTSPRPNGSSSQQLNTSNSGWVQRATVAARFERWETRKEWQGSSLRIW